MPSEFERIEWIKRRAGGEGRAPGIVRGIGDDCAILGGGPGLLAATADVLVENVHFRRAWASPFFLGRKSLAVNLSDLAAMGARPLCCLLCLAVPEELRGEFAETFLEAFIESAERFGCPLAGGDLSGGERLQISVTALGRIQQGEPLYRGSARDGDHVAVAGRLGLSRLGLRILEEDPPPGLAATRSLGDLERLERDAFRRQCLLAHLDPHPLLQTGTWLRERGLANAMIDVSDGLASDLWHIARGSGLSATLEAASLPLPQGPLDETMLLDAVLNGGEDYALLFTASRSQMERLRAEYPRDFPPFFEIGTLNKERPALFLREGSGLRELKPAGFDHFQ